MLSKFFGKGDKTPPKDAADSRGLEVVEDDPDTAWSMWDSALAEQDSRFAADPAQAAAPLPPITGSDAVPAVDPGLAPAPDLHQKTLEQRKNEALDLVELHHSRIANTIRTLWGYKECSAYINKLIMSGGDGMGHTRVGFNQEAVQAMMELTDVHDAQFGPMDSGGGLSLA